MCVTVYEGVCVPECVRECDSVCDCVNVGVSECV